MPPQVTAPASPRRRHTLAGLAPSPSHPRRFAWGSYTTLAGLAWGSYTTLAGLGWGSYTTLARPRLGLFWSRLLEAVAVTRRS